MLTVQEIRECLRKPQNAQSLSKARVHQDRIKFHTECLVQPKETEAYRDFMRFVKGLLPRDKFQLFKQLFRFPIKTNEVVSEIFEQLSRVKSGRNPAFNYQFAGTEERDDWEYYRQEVLHEPQVWHETAWEWFMTEINSLVVVDLPTIQIDSRPEPYFYWLRFSNVLEFKMDERDRDYMGFEWIIFQEPITKNIAVFDRESYRIFEPCDRDKIKEAPITEVRHDLGYTPVFFFWSTPIRMEEPAVKKSPLTKVLSSLDNYLFFSISKDHSDLYAAYPIYWGYEQECDYRNKETGDSCDHGFLRDKDGHYRLLGADTLCKCPVCADRRIAGAGTYVEVPAPTEIGPDLRNPIGIVTVDGTSLSYQVEEETRKRERIIRTVVGVDNQIVNDQAINESQVDATFESRNTVLNYLKTNFEKIQNRVDETVCRLRYGNRFLVANVNWGTDFFLLTAEELRNAYKTAKESGASEAELDTLKRQVLETEYRNNPLELQRQIILSEVEPYVHYTRNELLDLHSKGLADRSDVVLKLNFSTFVKRFERENLNLIEFAALLPFDEKIKIITNTLKQYANEQSNQD